MNTDEATLGKQDIFLSVIIAYLESPELVSPWSFSTVKDRLEDFMIDIEIDAVRCDGELKRNGRVSFSHVGTVVH